MTNPFKAGDRVKCVKGSRYIPDLEQGKKYTVVSTSSYNSDFVFLKETEGGWLHTRFELVETEPESDQQIADRVRKDIQELKKRGYRLTLPASTGLPNVLISKTKTINI